MAGIVKRIRELPGQDLFQYIDEAGERRSVESADVNAYLREAAGAGRGGDDRAAEDDAHPARLAVAALYRIFPRSCSARAAPIAVFTCLRSSGGGSTALRPRDSSHSSRVQPREW